MMPANNLVLLHLLNAVILDGRDLAYNLNEKSDEKRSLWRDLW